MCDGDGSDADASTEVLDYAVAAENQSFDTAEHRAVVEKFLAS